jgi:hypothetical protein
LYANDFRAEGGADRKCVRGLVGTFVEETGSNCALNSTLESNNEEAKEEEAHCAIRLMFFKVMHSSTLH